MNNFPQTQPITIAIGYSRSADNHNVWPAAFSAAAIVVSGSSSERGVSMRFHTLGNFGWLAPGTIMAEPLLKLRTVAGSGH